MEQEIHVDTLNILEKTIYKSIYKVLHYDHNINVINIIKKADLTNETKTLDLLYNTIYVSILEQMYDEINSEETFYIERFNWHYEPFTGDTNLLLTESKSTIQIIKDMFDSYLNITDHLEIFTDNVQNISFKTGFNPVMIFNELKKMNFPDKLIINILRYYNSSDRGMIYTYNIYNGTVTFAI